MKVMKVVQRLRWMSAASRLCSCAIHEDQGHLKMQSTSRLLPFWRSGKTDMKIGWRSGTCIPVAPLELDFISGLDVISCDFMCCDCAPMLWCDFVMLRCCDVAGPRMGEKIVLSDRARLSSDFKLSRNLSDQWFQISTCRWMGWGLHTWPGRRKYNPGGCWWESNCHELKLDLESKQVSSNSNSLNRWRTSNMSPFSACCNSKYSLYPKYVRFNVNGGILAPQTIWDWKKDGNSHPIEVEQILFAEGDWLSTCLSIKSALHFRAA